MSFDDLENIFSRLLAFGGCFMVWASRPENGLLAGVGLVLALMGARLWTMKDKF